MSKVHVVGGNSLISKMFIKRGWTISPTVKGADLIQLTGGADVSPSMYAQQAHPSTTTNPERDTDETLVFHQAETLHIPIAGICRGAQLLWVRNDGSLYQDVDNHRKDHDIYDFTTGDRICTVTSTHHQMMMYEKIFHDNILATCSESTRKAYMDYTGEEVIDPEGIDVEVAFFNDTKSLCFQPHPEYREGEMQDYYFQLIKDKLL